jgi:hypothetical protein
VTSAAAVDVPPLRIARHTRHKSLEMVNLPSPRLLHWTRIPRRLRMIDDPSRFEGDEVADPIGVGNPSAKTCRKIAAAVEAAGLSIHVFVRRGPRVLSLPIGKVGPDDEVLADDHPIFRKKGRQRVVVEAWGPPGDEILPSPDCEEHKERKRVRIRRPSFATAKYHFSPLGLHLAAERAREERRQCAARKDPKADG